jgi:hypothetical protein
LVHLPSGGLIGSSHGDCCNKAHSVHHAFTSAVTSDRRHHMQ